MDTKIKIKEVDITKDDRTKMDKIGDQWSYQQVAEITNLLKEYRDVFVIDYKELKGLVQEMGEMKINIKPDARPFKKRPYKLHISIKKS